MDQWKLTGMIRDAVLASLKDVQEDKHRAVAGMKRDALAACSEQEDILISLLEEQFCIHMIAQKLVEGGLK